MYILFGFVLDYVVLINLISIQFPKDANNKSNDDNSIQINV